MREYLTKLMGRQPTLKQLDFWTRYEIELGAAMRTKPEAYGLKSSTESFEASTRVARRLARGAFWTGVLGNEFRIRQIDYRQRTFARTCKAMAIPFTANGINDFLNADH